MAAQVTDVALAEVQADLVAKAARAEPRTQGGTLTSLIEMQRPSGDDDGQRPCARGERCAEGTAVRLDDGTYRREPMLGYRSFCATDRSTVLRTVQGLPERYLRLALTLGDKGSGTAPKVSGSRTPPVPVRVDVDALMAETI